VAAVDERFGWISESRQAEVAAWLRGHLGDWLQAWSVAGGDDLVVVAAPFDPNLPWRAWGQDEQFAMAMPFDSSQLGASLLGLAASGGDELATYLGDEASSDLLSRVGFDPEEVLPPMVDPLPRTLSDGRLGATSYLAITDGWSMPVAMNRLLAARAAPRQNDKRKATLERRVDGLVACLSKLTASIDLGAFSAGDFQGLSPGDVLVTDRSLAAPFDLYVSGQDRSLFRGSLGRLGDRRALLLDEHSKGGPAS
jgi:hypothetical protein